MSQVDKKKTAPKKVAEHPKYIDMVSAAIVALKERNGSSRQAILKYISANYKVGENVATQLKLALRRGIVSGALLQAKGHGASGSFKVPKKAEPKKPKKAVAKKPAAKKPAAKKSTPKKKPAAKKSTPKKAVKAAKKPAAKKPVSAKKAKATKKPAAKKPTTKKPVAKKVKRTPKKKAAAKK